MDNNEELVVIREYDSITRAETAKSLLESEGIFATIRNEGNDAKSGWCRIGSNDQNCTILVICVS